MITQNCGAARPAAIFLIATIAVALAAGGGYWLGGRQRVERGEGTAATTTGAPAERKILHYRNPMGLPDTSPTPKKDPMGMDYVPVYAGEQEPVGSAPGQIRISTDKVQKLGVRSEAARLRPLDREIRAAGRVEPDERRIYAISPKFEGYVERLHVNVTGQVVRRGQALFEVYSPELVSAQREYAIAIEGVEALKDAGFEAQNSMRQLADASLARLKNWDVSDEQLRTLSKSGESKRTLTFRSPVAGVVTEKKALQGMRFMPGEALYQIVDLSSVWVVADVFEQDIGLISTGAPAKVTINAYPGKEFTGKVAYVYPTLNAETRTVPVRVELANPGLLLKPSMFAQLELPVAGKGTVVTVPTSAVIDSGTRQIVLIDAGEGRFAPREVKLGARGDNHVEVVDGVSEGELVVVSANFLIDAESNLKAAVGGFGSNAPAAAASGAGHRAEGQVDGVDARAATVTMSHGPVESLKWPSMTMDFKVANDALLKNLQPGAAVAFEFVERGPGEWVITAVKPQAPQTGAAAAKPATKTNAHAGH